MTQNNRSAGKEMRPRTIPETSKAPIDGASSPAATPDAAKSRISPTRALMLASVSANAVIVVAAMVPLISNLPKFFGPEPERSLATMLALTTVNVTVSIATYAMVALRLIPKSEEAPAIPPAPTPSAPLVEPAVQAARKVLLSDARFAKPPVGVATTVGPHWVVEQGGGFTASDDLQLHHFEDLPASVQRLGRGTKCTRWQVIIYLDHTKEAWSSVARTFYVLTIYQKVARRLGAALDIDRLDLRVILGPPPRDTIVVLPYRDDEGDMATEVLRYVQTARGVARRIGVAINGPNHATTIAKAEQTARQAAPISLGALRAWLGPAVPNEQGFVPASAIQTWLSNPPPGLPELIALSQDRGVTSSDHFTM